MQAKLTWPNGAIDNSDTLISGFEFTDAISTPYCLKITCHGSKDASVPQAFDPITFNFNTQKISGMLTQITRHEDPVKQRWDYVLEMRPRLYILALRRTIKLYPNASIYDIVLDLLAEARISLGAQNLLYENLITNALYTTPFKRLEISYADNDLAYLQSLIQYGIRFCFEEREEGEQVVFVDAAYKLPRHPNPLVFAPDKKEDVHQDAPAVYKTVQRKKLVPAHGCALFYDPESVATSLKNLMQTSQTPNDKVAHHSGDTSLYMAKCYSPPAIENAMSDRINQTLHALDHSYELHSYYSSLRAGEQITIEGSDGFIEAVKLIGTFAQDAWRFDSVAKFRQLSDASWLGAFVPRMPLPATLTGAEIQSDEQVNDLGEFKVKFPERLVTDANNDPWVSLRDLQNTSTHAGGTSHSMSGSAEVLIASQNGAPYHWMILGSLDNNERPSLVKSDNYRESRMSTTGGVNIHLRRQDASNPYSEINMGLKDSQNNPAGINLGTSLSTMQDNAEQHGIQEVSSGYAKRSIMGNFYDTVGDPQNPAHQVSLIQNPDSGMTTLTQQTNVSESGTYSKNYYTDAVGAQNIQTGTAAANANYSDEFKLFVATVYGESVGQGPAAWQAVASVIMNRVGGPDWKSLTTVTKVITQKGAFAAYYSNRAHGPDAQFILASNYLNNPDINKPPAKLSELIQTIAPIYKKTMQPTTDAIYYYSPGGTRMPPYIDDALHNTTIKEIFVKGVSPNDFRFFKKIK